MRRLLGLALATVVVVLGACSDDGGGGSSDETTDEATDAADSDVSSVRVVTLNLLHGLFCVDNDFCHAPDRVELLYEQLEAADCPELVGLQEIGPRQEELIPPSLNEVCDGAYELAWEGEEGPDRSMVFSSLPIVDQGYLDLAAFPWAAYWVQVDSDIGSVDFLTTHFASSANNPICAPENCPPICEPGIDTNQCNALEVVEFLDQNADPGGVTIVGGDLNATPGEPTIETFLGADYFDAWIEAGNAECDRDTGEGCTGGGGDETALEGLDVPTRVMTERIDYLMVRAGGDCTADVEIEGFANEPLEEPVNDLYWVSDHTGLLGTVFCG
jgi:Endonuclease/Exonuclease/phosphatase family